MFWRDSNGFLYRHPSGEILNCPECPCAGTGTGTGSGTGTSSFPCCPYPGMPTNIYLTVNLYQINPVPPFTPTISCGITQTITLTYDVALNRYVGSVRICSDGPLLTVIAPCVGPANFGAISLLTSWYQEGDPNPHYSALIDCVCSPFSIDSSTKYVTQDLWALYWCPSGPTACQAFVYNWSL